MEAFLDSLLAFLVANVSTTPSITWILGDPSTSIPTSLPFGYVIPLWDNVKPYASMTDMDTYAVPILIVDDVHNYAPPITNVNVAGALEAPGYRKLMQYGQTVRDALRGGGAGVTVEGIAATSAVSSIRYVWPQIDKKFYRGVQLAFVVQQRRRMGTLPATH